MKNRFQFELFGKNSTLCVYCRRVFLCVCLILCDVGSIFVFITTIHGKMKNSNRVVTLLKKLKKKCVLQNSLPIGQGRCVFDSSFCCWCCSSMRYWKKAHNQYEHTHKKQTNKQTNKREKKANLQCYNKNCMWFRVKKEIREKEKRFIFRGAFKQREIENGNRKTSNNNNIWTNRNNKS